MSEQSAPDTAEQSAGITSRFGQAPRRHRARAAMPTSANGRERAPDPRGAGALDLLVGDLVNVLSCEVALVCDVDSEGQAQVGASWGVEGAVHIAVPRHRGRRWGTRRQEPGGNRGCFVGRALSHGRPAFETLDPAHDAGLLDAAGTALTHALAVPVQRFGHDDAKEMLVAGFTTVPADLERAFWVAASYAQMIALLDEEPGALTELLEHAHRDALTGCLTYARVLYELIREINRSDRAALPLSCCFVDLDGFKRVNDRYGHLAGNQVLADVGQALRDGVRSCDTVGRYGGDEFVAIFPQTNETEGVALARRLRVQIGNQHHEGFGRPVTASVGVAQWTPGTSSEELLTNADLALFAAKSQPGGVAFHSGMVAAEAELSEAEPA